MAALELDRQIPKRGDQRQMEAWQRIGTYAAGLALDSAGVKGNAALLSRMDMIVAAGGGERDYAVDAAILSALPSAADPGAYLNEHLLSDLRPTLFLAQLSNLLAGNISIVHGVVGSSRTFMGEEAAGTDAVRIACARIAAGQGELFLVGGSYNAQRPDVLLHYEMGAVLWKQPFAGVWAPPGARRRHGPGLGRLLPGDRKPRACRGTRRCHRWRTSPPSPPTAAGGARRGDGERHAPARCDAPASRAVPCRGDFRRIRRSRGDAEEAEFLRDLGLPVRASATAFGHSLEPSFPADLALAAMSLAAALVPATGCGRGTPMAGELRQALVTSWGHWRGEAMAVVEAA